ncbi:SSS family solute:Na+ symporter [Anseongella ginsenosidimutans]|uniref:SSS family solute:Na+ symporter n=1 Tax=Anseongella ginsenosidimutans TaxID=496056 RepID=A0A4R3KX80_9SPHI|nr:sodium:solute symporter [Anseongella ginsenosidimutans]QEC51057.1 sodium/solute symporter [Anseongella ginsenosidimutans]TCS90285.1 SSS family solute:Na+ symporter [Anseongella ginsenosidimutans]
MKELPLIDLTVIVLYLAAMVFTGFWFSRRNKNAGQFSKGSGLIPGWAVGISLYATFLSSNTFIGVPGKAFGSNWNAFVFSLSIPLAAWVASRYFVPFYRKAGEVSAYTHLEHRFGPWARTYAVICFLLTQVARIGSIFFGMALALQALTGYSMTSIMLVIGLCILAYTVLGGMEAVIWTEVVQAILMSGGALLIVVLILLDMPGGAGKILETGISDNKFSLGSAAPIFTEPTFWVILLYGFFINLNNFGVDQNYVQRYHTASSEKEASRSIWICAKLYVPLSLLFFVIGTCLYAYYQENPELTGQIKLQAAAEQLGPGASGEAVAARAATLGPADYGDKVMPHFMAEKVPPGLAGLIISAILAAGMSTISSGMNASATVFSEDIYKRYLKRNASSEQHMRALLITTAIFGIIGMAAGIAMIGVKSILDIWWELSGIFAGGMLGLFLLGIISRKAGNREALAAIILGVLIILWMTFSYLIPSEYSYLRNPLHANMIIVAGTLAIFLSGSFLGWLRKPAAQKPVS